MSRPETSSWQLLDALLENEPEGATREHLLQRTGLSSASFYRSIKGLLEQGFVLEAQGRYRMPLANFHNYRYKLWRDAEKLFRLPEATAHHILTLIEESRRELGEHLLAVWLVGSAAHDQMHEESDLYFLAVVKKPTLFSPRSSYDVNFVTLKESEFQEKAAHGDGFVWTALRYGLLLEDRGWARECLSTLTFPYERFTREHQADAWEPMADRFLSLIHEKEAEEALKTLRSLAVRLARRMLRTLGELPAGKPQLLLACDLYFGERLTNVLRTVFEAPPSMELRAMVRLFQSLQSYRQRYEGVRFSWETWATLAYAGPLEFESMSFALLGKLLPFYTLRRNQPVGNREWDFLATRPEKPLIAFECKSLERELTCAHLSRLGTNDFEGHAVVLVNAYRSVPPLQRPAFFSDKVRDLAKQRGIHLMTSLEFIRQHHLVDLEPDDDPQPLIERLEDSFPDLVVVQGG